MKKIRMYQVDAFADRLFTGNPAAVCIVDEWPADALMQSIAGENNLAETAFLVPKGDDYGIRWFTPAVEVDLCGHATLASAFVLFNLHHHPGPVIRLLSHRSGLLKVAKDGEMLFLDFPTDLLQPADGMKETIEKAIGIRPLEVIKGKTDYMAVLGSEKEVREVKPDLRRINDLDARGLMITARGEQVDFVSRFFAPQCGVNEDPVTGSAHTSLTPFWSGKLGKERLTALQLSNRGGALLCEYRGDRCLIGGKAFLYMIGEINIE